MTSITSLKEDMLGQAHGWETMPEIMSYLEMIGSELFNNLIFNECETGENQQPKSMTRYKETLETRHRR